MTIRVATSLAAASGFLAVALGAFGAHALKQLLIENQAVEIWEKAVLYHFIHTLVLLFLARKDPLPRGPWFCFLAGIVIFSGSLYLLAVTHAKWLGAITPVGGVSLLVGWGWLAVCGLRNHLNGQG